MRAGNSSSNLRQEGRSKPARSPDPAPAERFQCECQLSLLSSVLKSTTQTNGKRTHQQAGGSMEASGPERTV